MDVVEVWCFCFGVDEVSPDGVIWLGGVDGVPAHVWDFESGFRFKFDDLSFEDAEAWFFRGFITAFKEELIAYADSKEGFVIGDPLLDDVKHSCVFELT